MSDPRDIDEDAILKGLSAAELEQLECELQDLDPEVGAHGGGGTYSNLETDLLSIPGKP